MPVPVTVNVPRLPSSASRMVTTQDCDVSVVGAYCAVIVALVVTTTGVGVVTENAVSQGPLLGPPVEVSNVVIVAVPVTVVVPVWLSSTVTLPIAIVLGDAVRVC